jgi:two-component system, NtrC family, nitrogen regulation sensor histidine kinase GlnL
MNDSAQVILDNLSTAVLWFDAEFKLLIMNVAAENLLETSIKQARNTDIQQILVHEKLTTELFNQILAKQCPLIERSLRLHFINNRSITVDCVMTPLPLIEENTNQAYLLVELMQVDQHLRLSREEHLLAQQQAARNVIRGLAHEIKNPLGGLRGAAQLLERELPTAQLREYTAIIINEADRLQSLLDRMLQPHSYTHKRITNIHQILLKVRQLLLSEVGNSLSIVSDFDPSIPEFSADPDQLTQAILNIMRNAAQSMQGQGNIILRTRIHRQMTLVNKRHKLVLGIEVEDNGPGIAHDIIDQIFYPLVTARADGSGLGLSIAQKLINQNGGIIECESLAGRTIFTLWLPLLQTYENT